MLPISERHGVTPYNDVKLTVGGISVRKSNFINAVFIQVFRQGSLKVTDDDYCLMKCDAVYSGNLFTHVSEKTCSLLFRTDIHRKWKQ